MADQDSTTTRILRSLERIAEGDDVTQSRNELFTSALKRIRGLVTRAIRSWPSLGRWEEPEDLLQNVLIRIDRAVQDLRPTSAGQFFVIVAQHVQWATLDLVRRHSDRDGTGRHHQNGRPEHAVLDQYPGTERSEEANVSHQIDFIRLHEAVDRLATPEREAWQLHYYLGMTQEQTADCLGVSSKTIQRRIQLARAQLATELQSLRPKQ